MASTVNITKESIEALHTEAFWAGDRQQVTLCDIALGNDREDILLRTAKGGRCGTLEDVCQWQAEYQGGRATICGIDVDDVEFDPENIGKAILAVRDLTRGLCAEVVAAAEDRRTNGKRLPVIPPPAQAVPLFEQHTPLGYGQSGEVFSEVRLDERPFNQRGTMQVTVTVTIDGRFPLLTFNCTTLTVAFARLGCDPPNGGYWTTFNGASGPVASSTLEALRRAWHSAWVSKYSER